MIGTVNSVLNDGTISGRTGISIGGDQSSIVNTGTILGDFSAVSVTSASGTSSLVNQGVISSTQFAINCLGYATFNVVNQGAIIGLIRLDAGNDRLVNNGTIVGSSLGAVMLGEGGDTYDGRRQSRWLGRQRPVAGRGGGRDA